MLENQKQLLKRLIAEDRMGELFTELMDLINPSSAFETDLLLLESEWRSSKHKQARGTIDLKDQNLSFNSIKEALLWVINELEFEDIKPIHQSFFPSREFIAPDYSYTCNRTEQNDEFQLHYYDPPPLVLERNSGKVFFSICMET